MGFELMRRSFGPIWKAFSHNTWSAQLLSLRFTFNENGFFKTVQRRGAAILKKVSFQSLHSFWSHLKSLVHKRNLATPSSLKVGTGPTLASKLTMDILAWSFIASLGLLAAQPSVLVMKMVTLMMMMWWCFVTFTINFLITQMALLPGLLLGLTSICAHNWFHLSDHTAGLRRFLYFFLSLFASSAGCTLSCAGFTSTCLSPRAGIGGSPTDSPTMSSQICTLTLRFYKTKPKPA